jgi:hypothetical protein
MTLRGQALSVGGGGGLCELLRAQPVLAYQGAQSTAAHCAGSWNNEKLVELHSCIRQTTCCPNGHCMPNGGLARAGGRYPYKEVLVSPCWIHSGCLGVFGQVSAKTTRKSG